MQGLEGNVCWWEIRRDIWKRRLGGFVGAWGVRMGVDVMKSEAGIPAPDAQLQFYGVNFQHPAPEIRRVL